MALKKPRFTEDRPSSPRRDVLGTILKSDVVRAALDGARPARRDIFGKSMEVTALLCAQYDSASEMPGAVMLADIRHERFCQAVARGMDYKAACRNAGWKSRPEGLLEDPKLLNRIAYYRRLGVEAAAITPERIARELGAIAFANVRDAVEWEGASIRLKASGGLSDTTASAISEVKQTKEGLALKMHDKLGALRQLMLAQGLAIERLELTGKDGKPIATTSGDPMTAQQAADAYAALIKEDQS